MRFNKTFIVISFLLVALTSQVNGTIIDRIVASIDDHAITQSELDERYNQFREINEKITYAETLETMINRLIILKDAKKFRIKGKDKDDIIKQYTDLKIRALIRIQDKDIRKYYLEHQEEFVDKKYEDVYKHILEYLTEAEVNKKLREHISSLRKQSDIMIHLDAPE